MPVPLLVPKAAHPEAKKLGAIWDFEQRVWLWPDEAARDAVKGWLPRMYKPGVKPPHILPRMIPTSTFGINLRSLIPEAWPKISREYRADFGNRCQVCGSGSKVECHEDWEYVFNASSRSGSGIQRLRRLAALCRNCHELKHLGKTEMSGRTEQAMRHLAFVNGWTLGEAERAARKAWADWELRNCFDWKLDVSWAEREYALSIDVGSERIGAIREEARKRFESPRGGVMATPVSAMVTVPSNEVSIVAHEPAPAPSWVPISQWSGGGGGASSGSSCGVMILAGFLGLLVAAAAIIFFQRFRPAISGGWLRIGGITALLAGTLLLAATVRPIRRLLLIGTLLYLLGAGARWIYWETLRTPPKSSTAPAAKSQRRPKHLSGTRHVTTLGPPL